MFTAPTMHVGQRLQVVCQDARLMELCDTSIITAMVDHNPLGDYGNTSEILAVAAVLRRIFGQFTVVDLCEFIENHHDLTKGLVALTQDGVSSFDNTLGNFLDIGSGFDSGLLFITRERYTAVWEFLQRMGVHVPPKIMYYQTYDLNIFGEPGLWVKPVHLGIDGVTIKC
ncbi:hypothetical protein pEaSNUABM29_00169 [Erwinia phage pEa_SNUABM_29]|nr:hypothetical protein pEaSNUABM29_00169 [Erwinia phage pEa_SNUABM_29]